MPSYKLHYFNGKGRAEGSRMLFALAGVEYEDVRHKWEDWLKIKPDIQFHKLPYLEVDDVIVTQSRAIERYLARKFGYYGKTELEQTRIDMVIDCIEDMIHNLGEINKVDSEEKKDEIRKTYTDSIVPGYLEDFQKLIAEDGHFLEGEISWADISLYGSLFIIPLYLGVNLTEVVEKYPKVKTLCHAVVSNPKIAEWIKNRPDTKF